MFGLRKDELQQIIQVLSFHVNIHEAILFGSRATNNHKKTSDIDLAVKGELAIQEISAIQAELNEETSLPYFFDIVNYDTLKNTKLKRQINKNGKIIYRICCTNTRENPLKKFSLAF